MTDDENEYAALLRNTMVERGILKEIEGKKYQVISNDTDEIAACFEQANREWAAKTRH